MAKKELQKTEVRKVASPSDRFTATVMRMFSEDGGGGSMQVTEQNKRLIANYFYGIDMMLREQEENRQKRNAYASSDRYKNDLPYTWENVDLNALAMTVVDNARLGLDILLPNHIHAVPFKDTKTQKYRVTMIHGYNGVRVMSERYALDKPLAITTELVYENDKFKALKKNVDRPVESYEFEITDPFNRGEIVGGFGYHEYEDKTKNKLIIMTIEDILKRRPDKYSVEFWGGTKKQKVGGKWQETEIEGWYDEMCLKTLKRHVYSSKHIPLDNYKVDEMYLRQLEAEANLRYMQAKEIEAEEALTETLDIDDMKLVGEESTESSEDSPKTVEMITEGYQSGKSADEEITASEGETDAYFDEDDSWKPTEAEQLEMPYDL